MTDFTQFLISYGGLLLFLIGFAEQSGLPLPGAPWLLAAGALAASGRFNFIAAICWAAIGSLAADTIWFYVGQRGKSCIFRLFPHLHAVRARLDQATCTGSILHGARMLTAAKFLPLGTVIPLHAGALEVASSRFLLVDAFSSVFYAAVYVSLGFSFHNQLEQVVAFTRKLGGVSLLLIVLLAGTYVVYHFLKRSPKQVPAINRSGAKAEETEVLHAHDCTNEIQTTLQDGVLQLRVPRKNAAG